MEPFEAAMGLMQTVTYQIWDDDTGNVIASYGSRDAAVAFLRGMLATNGPSGVSQLVIVAYPADGSDPIAVLEGAELLAAMSAHA